MRQRVKKKHAIWVLGKWVVVLLAFCVYTVLFSSAAHATEISVESFSDWETGTMSDTRQVVQGTGVEIIPDGSWNALSWKTPDKTIGPGSSFTADSEYIYVLRGYGDVVFWRYDPSRDEWTTLHNSPVGVYYGGDIKYQNGYVYALFGGYQKTFGRYSIADDEWELLHDYPDLVWQGASLESDGTDVYGITANNTQSFYKYVVQHDNWILLSTPPNTLRGGADLERIGDYIYTPRGNNTNHFYRYSISSNTWATLATLPVNISEDTEITSANGVIYLARQSNTTNFYAYTIVTNEWTSLDSAPLSSRYAGVQYFQGDGNVYFFRGNGDYRFWKYSISGGDFIGPRDAPNTLSTGSNLIYSAGYLYVPRGSNTATFYRYDISANTWDTMTDAEGITFNDDVRGTVAGGYVYFFRGSNTNTFLRYVIASDTWETLATTPYNVRYGGTIAYPGSGNYLYATRGASTSGFWRYDYVSDTWDDAVVADLPSGVIASYGSTLVSNGTDLFFFGGTGLKRFYKYTIASDTWTELARLPFSPFYGTDATCDGNGHIVALAGDYSSKVWQYSIASDSWTLLGSFPSYGPTEIGTWTGAGIVHVGSGVFYISRGGGRLDMLTLSKTASEYKSSGMWTSSVYDLVYVDDWNGISVSTTTPGDSSVLIETRTSDNSVTWDSWTALASGEIASTPRRFFQFRGTLIPSTGGSRTPTLQAVTVDYDGDSNSPGEPPSVTAKSQEIGGVVLAEGTDYTYSHPYFEWSAATDAESAVAGYYVYWGTTSDADPVTDGSYQTGLTYAPNHGAEDGSNYLRIAAIDTAGNIGNISTLFGYTYNGVSPVQSMSIESIDMTGTTVDTQVTDSGAYLEHIEDGFWLENRLTYPPRNFGYGARTIASLPDEQAFYVLSGQNNQYFYRYDTALDIWTERARTPGSVYYGGGVVEGPSGYLFGLRGYNSTDFWKYSIQDDTWDAEIASAPLTVGYGGSMVFDGEQYIYVLRGNNTDYFWRYDTFQDTWENLSKTDFGSPSEAATNNVYVGGDLAFDSENELIYAIQGNYYSGLSVYDINTETWAHIGHLPDSPSYGASIEYYADTNSLYYESGNYRTNMYRYDISSGEWTRETDLPTGFYYGGGLHIIDDYFYAFRGGNSTLFYKYDIQRSSWLLPTRGLFSRVFEGSVLLTSYYGADIVKGDGDNFYITRGYYDDEFIRWNQSTGQVTVLPNAPMGMYVGGSMAYDSVQNRIYLTGGIMDRGFFYYDISQNTWGEDTTDMIPIAANAGSSMVYDGSQYVYLSRAGGTNTFYRYDTQETDGNRWSTMANVSATLYYGSELLYKDGEIFTLRGYNVNPNPFYSYSVTANTWSPLTSLLTQVYNDGFLADGNNGYFYAARGANTSEFYKYSVSEDTWSALGSFPGQIYAGGSGESNMNDKLYVLSGNGSNTYSDALYTYVYETDDSSFVEDGYYESQIHDLTRVYKWAGILIKSDVPPNTGLTVETCTSANGSIWSEWAAVSRERASGDMVSYRINSPANRYIKVRFSFHSGDGIYSPLIESYEINYYQDIDNPTNPTDEGFVASSEDGGDPITSEQWYNHPEPFFDWVGAEVEHGASDGVNGSGVVGYYVYWGSVSDADPAVSGTVQEETEFSPTTLVDGTTYYLRIRTVDDAGNLSDDTWQPFVYLYDSSSPSIVAGLSADPSGYTAVNSYTFQWDVSSASGSPVDAYCYKTGATFGVYSSDQCASETTISSIPAYKVGSNTFLVRVRDTAGNYSDYASVAYFYVDAENAPAPPTNLQVEPEVNTSNSFRFSWDPPLSGTFYGSVSNLTYLYSVNALPSEYSTSATPLRYLNSGAYATLPGENIFYIVTKDEAGNVNYDDYAQIPFYANTVAPGIPVNVEIADVSMKSTASWRLAVSWDPPEDEGSGVAGYQVYRSLDGEEFTFHSYTSGISLVDSRLEQMIYYYKTKACDSTNNCGAFSSVVSLFPDGRYTEPAEVIVPPVVSDVSPKRATVSWVTARTADSRLAYGIAPGDYFEAEVSNSQQVVDHILLVNNLSPGTKYYYVVRWTDEDGNIGESEEDFFVTAPPPSIREPVVKHVGLDSALIEFTTKDTVKIKVYYGETSAFGGTKEVYTGSSESSHSVDLSNLKHSTKYFYKINTIDIDNEEYEGEIHSFETLPRPQILDPKVYQVKGTSNTTLLVEWSVNTPISSVVTYFPVTQPERALDEVNVGLKGGVHRMVLMDLEPNTPYDVVISGKDFMGNEATSGTIPFTTASDTRPPSVFDLEVTSEILGSGQEASAQLVVSYKTDEEASSQLEYGEGTGTVYSQKTQEDTQRSLNHIVIISGLTPSKVYHLRAVSKDDAGNEGFSVDKVVVTNPSTEDAYNLVIRNLISIFSFLNTNP